MFMKGGRRWDGEQGWEMFVWFGRIERLFVRLGEENEKGRIEDFG